MYQPQFRYHVPRCPNAGQCVLCCVVFGFGLLMMGTIAMAASTAFEPKPNFGPQTNIPGVIGAIFLGVGCFVFLFGVILMIVAIRKLTESQNNPQHTAISTTTYQQQPYPPAGSTQPYLATGEPQQPLLSGAPVQGYQPYPPPQGQPYPGPQGQPNYPTGPGQHYPGPQGQSNFPAGPGQPYQGGPGQSNYPTGPGPQRQSYPTPPGQPYPGPQPEKTDPANYSYNPGQAQLP